MGNKGEKGKCVCPSDRETREKGKIDYMDNIRGIGQRSDDLISLNAE